MSHSIRSPLRILAYLAVAGAFMPAAQAQPVHMGAYECWSNNRARMMLNFTLLANGQYTDANGERGSFSFDGRQVTFRGGALDGQRPVYEVRSRRPTVSFIGASGAEAAFCEAAG